MENSMLKEMMTVEINFGKDRTDEIKVNYGDNPVELAQVNNFFNVLSLTL
jgi:hypothetical protein